MGLKARLERTLWAAPSRLLPPLVAGVAILLAGCSNSHELHTPSEANSFIVAVARGENTADWHLAQGAGQDAARVWAERGAIHDLGRRLRHIKAAWACEFAEGSGVIGFGKFTEGDRLAVTEIAKNKGAKPVEIHPLLADVRALANSDLKAATAAVCG
jgi:hypothetical protein